MELLPELITKIFILIRLLFNFLALNSGNDNRVEYVVNGTTTTKVVDRFTQTLQHWPNSQGSCFALYGFVNIIAGVQIGEYQYAGSACYLRAR